MKTNNINTGIVFVGLFMMNIIQILFITLKLTKTITWSWWWVLSPAIIAWILILALCTLVIVLGIYVESIRNWVQ